MYLSLIFKINGKKGFPENFSLGHALEILSFSGRKRPYQNKKSVLSHTVLSTLLILAVYRTHVTTNSVNMTSLVTNLPVAQWLERPTGVRKVMGSILVGDSDFFFVPHSWQTEYPIFLSVRVVLVFVLESTGHLSVSSFIGSTHRIQNLWLYTELWRQAFLVVGGGALSMIGYTGGFTRKGFLFCVCSVQKEREICCFSMLKGRQNSPETERDSN